MSVSIFDNVVRVAFRAVHSSSIERHFFTLSLLCITTEFYSSHTSEVAYLPVYVETKNESLALMAVASQACKSIYVTFSSLSETKQEWEKRKYLGIPSR